MKSDNAGGTLLRILDKRTHIKQDEKHEGMKSKHTDCKPVEQNASKQFARS